ncbi:MAG: cytochrome c family protein [Rhizobiales bacterium]|nr:cytochrome c family protein [Hyphomicrobiales bacterium]MCW5684546.1 cytochrome c family protein [Pseudolabrys sp.]OJY42040.1 MAG: cytochrome C [Rhizobiales bacterium 64-17]
MRTLLGLVLVSFVASSALAAEGDPTRGQQAFRACAPCHSLTPDRNMTGPSLARLWGRRAGSLPSFERYSPALKSAQITWNEQSLDSWLVDPAHMVPGNRMTFPGIKNEQTRADLIAFLKQTATSDQTTEPTMPMGGMMGGGGTAPNLRTLSPSQRVQTIMLCRDTYRVTTADGTVHEFWERNLRFKTDSSPDGPEKGAPAILGAGMMGDRASVIFAAPNEISDWIKPNC